MEPQALLCISDSDPNLSFYSIYSSGLVSFFISGTLRFPSLDVKLSYISKIIVMWVGADGRAVRVCPAVSAQSTLLTGNKSMGVYKLNSPF